MSNFKIELSGKKVYETELKIRISQINYGNHLGNDAWVAMLQEVRLQWLTKNGFTEVNLGADGVGLIQTNLQVIYKKQVFYGEVIFIELWLNEVTTKSLCFTYNAYKFINNEKITCLLAETEMLCYNYKQQKIVGFPENFKAILHI